MNEFMLTYLEVNIQCLQMEVVGVLVQNKSKYLHKFPLRSPRLFNKFHSLRDLMEDIYKIIRPSQPLSE